MLPYHSCVPVLLLILSLWLNVSQNQPPNESESTTHGALSAQEVYCDKIYVPLLPSSMFHNSVWPHGETKMETPFLPGFARNTINI
jgi:hypothetical protein